MHRAAVYARVKGDYGPLQVETIKLVQRVIAKANESGQELLRQNKLTHGVSDRMKLGNHIDREVRQEVRKRFNRFGIKIESRVRVNRRILITSEGRYTLPDIKIDNVFIEISIQAKNMNTLQIAGFFRSEAKPEYVVVATVRQTGENHTYVIKR